ncbi:hypothetical protein DFP72DRAFT_179064 [Ephemerocybe angulata]|uniref:Uncharacterized protein n=1 Tax=Ephemerocybe angulata TaxID=980116 RepID=A0A8H6MAB4_9AGAR|nr:hypothetical protein DFP72DRAFT_179064 [Tulosesus angulatus]
MDSGVILCQTSDKNPNQPTKTGKSKSPRPMLKIATGVTTARGWMERLNNITVLRSTKASKKSLSSKISMRRYRPKSPRGQPHSDTGSHPPSPLEDLSVRGFHAGKRTRSRISERALHNDPTGVFWKDLIVQFARMREEHDGHILAARRVAHQLRMHAEYMARSRSEYVRGGGARLGGGGRSSMRHGQHLPSSVPASRLNAPWILWITDFICHCLPSFNTFIRFARLYPFLFLYVTRSFKYAQNDVSSLRRTFTTLSLGPGHMASSSLTL